MIKKGDEISAVISDLNSEGKGITKMQDGYVIFVNDALPGDKALVKIKKTKSNYAEASLLKLEIPSQNRIPAKCKHFGICGGCKIQNLIYESQISYKTNFVKNALERIGEFGNLNVPPAVKSDDVFFYRNKMEFSFSDDEWKENVSDCTVNNNFALGLHVPKFHSKIVNLTECFLQSDESVKILNFTRDFFIKKNIKAYSSRTQSGFLRFLVIRQSIRTNELMVNLITFDYDKNLMMEFSESLSANFPGVTDIINSTSGKLARIAVGEEEIILKGKGYITEILQSDSGKEFKFLISPQSFFQTNTKQAEKLFDLAVKLSELNTNDRVLDLYCGTGSISFFISEFVNNVKGVELNPDSIKDAGKNARLNGIDNVHFVCSDIKDFMSSKNNYESFNKLILDPPRSGLHPKICEILSETEFEKIVYVSCNPHTQARDLRIICGKGTYKISKIQPVDMFPHTYHIENVVLLESNE